MAACGMLRLGGSGLVGRISSGSINPPVASPWVHMFLDMGTFTVGRERCRAIIGNHHFYTTRDRDSPIEWIGAMEVPLR